MKSRLRWAWGAKRTPFWKSGTFWTAAATVAIAVFTGFLVHYSGRQWFIMSETLRASERPILTLGEPPVTRGSSHAPAPVVSEDLLIHFKNTGRGPAQNPTIEVWLVFLGEKVNASAVTIERKTPQYYQIIPPSESLSESLHVTPSDMDRLNTTPAIIQGRIIYSGVNDILSGSPRVMNLLKNPVTYCDTFCAIFHPRQGRFNRCGSTLPLCDGFAHEIPFGGFGESPRKSTQDQR